jgi:uncharacterized protein YjaG (DUF416 family)
MASPQMFPQFSKKYAQDLYCWAAEFYSTYQAVVSDSSFGSYLGVQHNFIGMRHYTLCHALELTLKSLLVNTGNYDEQKLKKKFGHDLVALADEVKQNYGSFPEVDACMAWAKHLNPDYKGKGYEYPINNGSFKGVDAAAFSNAVDALLHECMSRVNAHI